VSIKAKLGMGVASAVLGMAMVGGGTWAAFTDEEVVKNSFVTGTLNLDVTDLSTDGYAIKLSNIKPGDQRTYDFKLDNIGSLSINEVLLTATAGTHVDGSAPNEPATVGSTQEGFLKQFVIGIQNENGGNVIDLANNVTLWDLVTNNAYKNLDVLHMNLEADRPNDVDTVHVTIKMKNEGDQNVYQNDSGEIIFNLKATQEVGNTITEANKGDFETGADDVNRYIEFNESQPNSLNWPN
jgi:spore coat-associated protein N